MGFHPFIKSNVMPLFFFYNDNNCSVASSLLPEAMLQCNLHEQKPLSSNYVSVTV